VEHSIDGPGRAGESAGGSLAARLSLGPLPLQSALRYAAEVAGTLRQLHEDGRFHGDVEPGFVRITEAGALLLPPNGHAHLATARDDISEFGALLYQMLTGAKPNGDLPAAAREGDRENVRLAATRLAARCLGTLPGRPADIQKVSTEVRLLGVLARQHGAQDEIPATPVAPTVTAPVAAAAPETAEPRTISHPDDRSAREKVCPRCREHLTAPSRPHTALEALLHMFHVPIRRCGRCFHRYVILFDCLIERSAHE
jgi:hypothetical protein